MADWTKEPWAPWQNKHGWQVSQDAGELSGWGAHIRDSTHPDHQEANARRICDAVNFCASVDLTPALEAGVTLGDVVRALQATNAALCARSCWATTHGEVCLKNRDTFSLFQKDADNG